MTDEYLRLDQIDKKNIRETTYNEIKYLETQEKNKRKISHIIYYFLITAFILQTSYLAFSLSKSVAFSGREPGVIVYILLGIIVFLIFKFGKYINNNAKYPLTLKLKGVYRIVKDDEYAGHDKVRYNHFFHPYQVNLPKHWLDMGYLKEGEEYTFEGCPAGFSFLRDSEDENYEFGVLNIYGEKEPEQTEDEYPEEETEDGEEEEYEDDVYAVDFIYSVVSINQKLSIDQEMKQGLNGFRLALKYSIPKYILLISLLAIYFFGIIDAGFLITWGKQRLNGAEENRYYENITSFIATPPVLNQHFTIGNACILSKNYHSKYLVDIDKFEKDFIELRKKIIARCNEISRLAGTNNYRLKSKDSWYGYSRINNHPEFTEMKKAMLNQDESLTSLRNLPEKNRVNTMLKRVITGMANKQKYMNKLYEAEAKYLNKMISDLLPDKRKIEISVNTLRYHSLPGFNTYALRFSKLGQKRLSKISDIINNCRRDGSVSGILLDYRFYKTRLSYIKFQQVDSTHHYLAKYFLIKPYVELVILFILISAFLYYLIKDRATKSYNKKLTGRMKRFYRIYK